MGCLIEAAGGEVVFFEAEEVAEFVVVGEADFLAVGVEAGLGVGPDIAGKEEDFLGERARVVAPGVAMVFADEEAEGIGVDAVAAHGAGGAGLEEEGDVACDTGEVFGEGKDEALDFAVCDGVELLWGGGHGGARGRGSGFRRG